jgi:hypothetical protein
MQLHKGMENWKRRSAIYMERHRPLSIPIKEDLLYLGTGAAPHKPTKPGLPPRPGFLYGSLRPLVSQKHLMRLSPLCPTRFNQVDSASSNNKVLFVQPQKEHFTRFLLGVRGSCGKGDMVLSRCDIATHPRCKGPGDCRLLLQPVRN